MEEKNRRSFDTCIIRIPVIYNSVHKEEKIFEIMAEKFLELKTVRSSQSKKLDKK